MDLLAGLWDREKRRESRGMEEKQANGGKSNIFKSRSLAVGSPLKLNMLSDINQT